MASPSPKRTFESRYPPRPAGPRTEDVDPIWLLKGLGIAFGAAAILGYLSICLLVFQGGWQRMLTPTHTVSQVPSVPFQTIPFDSATTGQPRLTGWWIPATKTSALTMLFLHDGTGSLSDTISSLGLLHQAGVNVFAFDYRGFGLSAPPHPNEVRMNEDAAAALNYLTETRHIPPRLIIPYGQGLGTVLATRLVNEHPDLAAIILEAPDPQALSRVVDDSRSRLLPMRFLIRDRFDINAVLARCKKPKLLLTSNGFGGNGVARVAANQRLFRSAPDPKLTVTFATPQSNALYLQTLSRFLDQYVMQKGL